MLHITSVSSVAENTAAQTGWGEGVRMLVAAVHSWGLHPAAASVQAELRGRAGHPVVGDREHMHMRVCVCMHVPSGLSPPRKPPGLNYRVPP